MLCFCLHTNLKCCKQRSFRWIPSPVWKKHHTNCASAFNAELKFSVPRPAHKSLDQKWKVKYRTGKAFKSKNQCKGWLLSINSKIWQCVDISWHKPLNSCSWSGGSNGVFVSRSSWKQALLSSVLAGQIMDIGRCHIIVTDPSILGQRGPDQSEGVRQIYLELLLYLCRGTKAQIHQEGLYKQPWPECSMFLITSHIYHFTVLILYTMFLGLVL